MNTNVVVAFKDDPKLVVGHKWNTVKVCRMYLINYGINNKFEIWFQKNNVDKFIFRCKVRTSLWRCYVRRLNDEYTMVCTGLIEEHTYVNDEKNNNSMANAKWIVKMIDEDMKMHYISYTARDIIKIVWHRYTVSIKYWKAWHARGLALKIVHGNYEATSL